MSTTDVPQQRALVEPRWGIPDAVVGWVVAMLAGTIVGGALIAAFGYTGEAAKADNLPLTMIALSYPPLWLGFVGAPVYAAYAKGNGVVRDFALRWKPIDLAIGIPAGLLSQLVLVPLVTLPVLWLSGKTFDDVSEPARKLGEKADSNLGVFLLVLVVVIGAPVAEELFFRGLLMRSIERKLGVVGAVAISAVLFGLTHFQALQLVALIAFGAVLGALVQRTGRLGTSIVAHMTFNLVTVINVVRLR